MPAKHPRFHHQKPHLNPGSKLTHQDHERIVNPAPVERQARIEPRQPTPQPITREREEFILPRHEFYQRYQEPLNSAQHQEQQQERRGVSYRK